MIKVTAVDTAGNEISCSTIDCGLPAGGLVMEKDGFIAYCYKHNPFNCYNADGTQTSNIIYKAPGLDDYFDSVLASSLMTDAWTVNLREEDYNLWEPAENVRFACSGNDCGIHGWHLHATGTNPKKIIKGRKRAMRKRRKKLESNTIKKGE